MTARRGAKAALAALLMINLFNYVDRQVLSAVEGAISDDFRLSATQSGWLPSAFLLVYMVMSPVFGPLADRVSRWKVIGVGVLVWTLASGASGLAWGYVSLLVCRCLVGVGEAAYGPAAPSLLADLFPPERRGRAMAWFYAAIPVGSAMGYVLGAPFAKSGLWHWAFLLTVPPGLVLGIWALTMKDVRVAPAAVGAAEPRAIEGVAAPGEAVGAAKPRVLDYAAAPVDAVDAPPGDTGGRRFRDVWRHLANRSYVLCVAGMTAMTFALGGIAYWMPRYLEKSLGLPPAQGTLMLGAITVVSGLGATLAGGWLADRLRTRVAGANFWVSAGGMLAAFPMFLGFLYSPMPWAWGLLFGAVFCLFTNTGPSNTVIADVVPRRMRATAFAVSIFVVHALGDVISPPLIGRIADASSLRVGFVVVSVMMLVGGLLWLAGVPGLARDMERATAADAAG